MRARDGVPLLLLIALAAFVGVQLADQPRRAEPGPEPGPGPAAAPQGAAAEPAASREPGQARVSTVAASPAPIRDETAIRARIHDGAPGTYINAVLDQQDGWIIRWPDRQFQGLRVWIQQSSDVANFEPRYPVAAEHAFDEWREAGFPIRFDIVRDSAGSDIQVRWVSQFPASNGRRIGVTNKLRDRSGWLVSAEIVVATHDSLGRPLPASLIAGVARHEAGHALGLAHSGSPSDVMFPESRTEVISVADRATLHLIYQLPPGRVQR